jgi:hypothetical protein
MRMLPVYSSGNAERARLVSVTWMFLLTGSIIGGGVNGQSRRSRGVKVMQSDSVAQLMVMRRPKI